MARMRANKAWAKIMQEDLTRGEAVVAFCGCQGRRNVMPPELLRGTCLSCGVAYSIAREVQA